MNKWNFQVEKSPKEISKILESSLGGGNRYALKMNYDNKNLLKFKIRKRVLLAFEIIAQNNIIVNGKIFKANPQNETNVEISFSLHPLAKLVLYVHIILGLSFLVAMTFKLSSNPYMFLIGAILLAIGILFGLHFQKVFNTHVQEYKLLLSKVLEI